MSIAASLLPIKAGIALTSPAVKDYTGEAPQDSVILGRVLKERVAVAGFEKPSVNELVTRGPTFSLLASITSKLAAEGLPVRRVCLEHGAQVAQPSSSTCVC